MESIQDRLERAQKRIRKIKGFYTHLFIFIVVNTVLFLIKKDTTELIIEKTGITEVGFANYLHWQFWTITLSWGLILVIQGLRLFGYPLIANWEKRKIREIMNQETRSLQNNKSHKF